MSDTFVFTGPTLDPREAENLLTATFLPPVKRGDLRDLASKHPAIVAIIDGEFFQSLAVSPKEILPLLDLGTRVYGAASMGALRAVELSRFGMIGIGRVFRLFRRGVLDADDEVAVAYDPATYNCVSEPLVNTRYTLRAAVRAGVLTRAEALDLIINLKATYFPDRTRERLTAITRDRIGLQRAIELRAFIASHARDVKREDAIELLQRLNASADCARGASARSSASQTGPQTSAY